MPLYTYRYRSLPSGSTFPCTVAEQPDNVELNRFPHLLAYDHSRVRLERPGSAASDYINANYVSGYDRRRKAYIAAQSPFNARTICDFWLMIYQQRVSKVMAVRSHACTIIIMPNTHRRRDATQRLRELASRRRCVFGITLRDGVVGKCDDQSQWAGLG